MPLSTHFSFLQLVWVVYGNPNTYGSSLAYIVGLVLRLGGGEPTFGLEPYIPYSTGISSQFPFKTFSMVSSFIVLVTVSWLAEYLFRNKIINAKYDFCDCRLAYGGRTWTAKENSINEKAELEFVSSKEIGAQQYRNASFKLDEKL